MVLAGGRVSNPVPSVLSLRRSPSALSFCALLPLPLYSRPPSSSSLHVIALTITRTNPPPTQRPLDFHPPRRDAAHVDRPNLRHGRDGRGRGFWAGESVGDGEGCGAGEVSEEGRG